VSDPSNSVPIRPASTVVMLRKARVPPSPGPLETDARDEPFEVFMVRRSFRSEFVGGAYVFPGGAVDSSDSDLSAFFLGLSDEDASARLALDHGGLRWYAAAARELFEEAGVLLAAHANSAPIDPSSDPGLASQLVEWRRRLNAKEATFADVLEALGVFLDINQLHFFSHWVTPPGQPRRYDTRFFLCEMPAAQKPLHDGVETTDSLWITPRDALQAATEGRMTIIFPTLKNLELLASRGGIKQTIAWAKQHTPRVVKPRVAMEEGFVRILIPGDPGYEDAEEVN